MRFGRWILVAGLASCLLQACDTTPPSNVLDKIDDNPPTMAPRDYAELVLRDIANLGPEHKLKLAHSGPSILPGLTVSRYEHFYQGMLVQGDGLSFHHRDQRIKRARLRLHTVMPTLSAVDDGALRTAAVDALQTFLGVTTLDLHPDHPPECAQQIWTRTGPPVHGYRCVLVREQGASTFEVILAVANKLAIQVSSLDREMWSPTFITAQSGYHGLVGPFNAEVDTATGVCRLHSPWASTFDLKGNAPGDESLSTDVLSDSSCNFISPLAQHGVTTEWASEIALYVWDTIFGGNPLVGYVPNDKLPIYVNVVSGNLPVAGYLDATRSIYFNTTGPGINVRAIVMGHEVFHVLVASIGTYTNGPGETGAIAEGISTWFGIVTESVALGPGLWDWLIPRGGDDRDVTNPVAYGRPDVYQGVHWIATTNLNVDNGGVHRNQYVLLKWVSLLVDGGSGNNSNGTFYDVTRIGEADDWDTSMALPTRVSVAAMLESSLPNDTFADFRVATQFAADEFCGDSSLLSKSVHDAWYAVGLETTIKPEVATTPLDGAIEVHPWPVKFSWPVDPNHPRYNWILEIADNPDFTNATQHPVTDVENPGGAEKMVAEITLPPGRDFYWRVWPNDSTPYTCWWATRTFSTGDAVPVPISPQGSIHPPWKLKFEVGVPAGTEYIEIDVGYEEELAATPPAPTVPRVFPLKRFDMPDSKDYARRKVELTLPKQTKNLYWRVRAHRGIYFSHWSNVVEFDTDKPVVELVGPGGLTHPWNIKFDWNPVPGAEYYEGGVLRGGNITFYAQWKTGEEHTEVVRSFHATANGNPTLHNWHVKAFGPRWGSEQQPEAEETREQVRSVDRPFDLHKQGTRVKLTAPIYNPIARGCQTPGNPLLVTWDAPPEFTATELRVRAIKYEEDFLGEVIYEEVIPAPATSFQLSDPRVVWPITASGGVQRQFRVELTARGPEYHSGVPGFSDDDYTRGWPFIDPGTPYTKTGRYFISQSKPTVLNPDDANVNWASNAIRMFWATGFVKSLFKVELYDGVGCAAGNLDRAVGVLNPPTGATAYQLFGPVGAQYSWRVRPDDEDACSNPPVLWSECTDTIVVDTTPPSQDVVACNTVIHEGGNFAESHVIELGQSSGTVTLRLNTFTVPDEMDVFYENQAIFPTGCYGTGNLYNGCSGACCCDDQGECECTIPYSGTSTQMQVMINPNCEGTPNTKWQFKLECPQ